jgi:molybdopterin-guanine dinucleotide biosynthesis protein A
LTGHGRPRDEGAVAERVPDCTGVLLAGGRATRLGGVAKGLLLVGGEPIAARSLRLFGEVFGAALVVASDPAPYAALGAPAVPDAIPDKGAPGGLHAALSAARTGWIFAAACDMPFLSGEAIRFLWALRRGAPAVAVQWGGRLEGLFAFWSRACLPEVERLVRGGEPSLWQLATAVGAEMVPDAAWRAFDPEGRTFQNANTPEDLGRLGLDAPGASGGGPLL